MSHRFLLSVLNNVLVLLPAHGRVFLHRHPDTGPEAAQGLRRTDSGAADRALQAPQTCLQGKFPNVYFLP